MSAPSAARQGTELPQQATAAPGGGSTVAERFVAALVAQDREALLALMAPRVRMRGMAPGRTWDSGDATSLVDDVLLGDFFGPHTEITGLSWSTTGHVQDVNSASYQLQMRKDGVDLECVQHAFFDVEAGRIHALHLMCSGFLARTPAPRTPR